MSPATAEELTRLLHDISELQTMSRAWAASESADLAAGEQYLQRSLDYTEDEALQVVLQRMANEHAWILLVCGYCQKNICGVRVVKCLHPLLPPDGAFFVVEDRPIDSHGRLAPRLPGQRWRFIFDAPSVRSQTDGRRRDHVKRDDRTVGIPDLVRVRLRCNGTGCPISARGAQLTQRRLTRLVAGFWDAGYDRAVVNPA